MNFPLEWSNKNATISLGCLQIKVCKALFFWTLSCHGELSSLTLRGFKPGCRYFETLAGEWSKVHHVECYWIPSMSVKALRLILQLCLSVPHFRAPLVQPLKVVNFLVPPGHRWSGQTEGLDSQSFQVFSQSFSVCSPSPLPGLQVYLSVSGTLRMCSSTSHPCEHPANWNVKSNTSHPSAFYLPAFVHTLLCALISFSTFFAPGGLCLLSSFNIILPGFRKRE